MNKKKIRDIKIQRMQKYLPKKPYQDVKVRQGKRTGRQLLYRKSTGKQESNR